MSQAPPWSLPPVSRRLSAAALLAVATAALLQAQIPGRNVNMVSGNRWPDGDPYLQRQNEGTMASSTRNPLHLLAGSNDYRTVDLPGLADAGETGDAWLGLYKSFDGGQRWKSTLLPGYPQDTSTAGVNSPLKGYQAAADPVVRPGSNGLFYYAGLVFDRTGTTKKSRVFVARFIDNNNKEAGDPIHYIGTSPVASDDGATGDFLDKPWLAVDIPRPGAKTCQIQTAGAATQNIAAGALYVAYTVIRGTDLDLRGTIMFSRSIDCGVSWSAPIAVSRPEDPVNQGATIAIDPVTGTVHIAWRRFALGDNGQDAIMVTRSAGGGGFESPRTLREFFSGRSLGQLMKFLVGKRRTVTTETPVVAETPDSQLKSFDQKTAADTFRTNAYPTMAIDGGGRVYLAWTERGFRTGSAAQQFDASIIMTTGLNGTWTTPFAVEPTHTGPGHQIMPSLAFAGGKLMLVYYDLREDISGVFRTQIDETSAAAVADLRHTVDLRATEAAPGEHPSFSPSVRVSEYVWGSRPNSNTVEQLQFNPPNLPLFQLGEVPFLGDYIDIAAAPAMVQDTTGAWKYNTAVSTAPVFHAIWTDNRDVKPPTAGTTWSNYAPPSGTQIPGSGGASVFDPTKSAVPCLPGNNPGMRNQNVYTSRITAGLLAGSPGNSKPLSATVPRAFVVFAQNTTAFTKYFKMTITSQPVGGRASFTQLSSEPVVTQVSVLVPSLSTVSKSVFATSSDPDARVPVDVVETATLGGSTVPNGLSAAVILNPDISNPDISNPDISNPDISNPDISNAEVYNPDISNPDISNPDISNPDISNPDISNPDISNVVILNPDISNPDISNPDISNPDISNPDISNPDISNPDISNGSVTDVTWTVENQGNTTANYTLDVLGSVNVPQGIKVQIIVYKTYQTPVSDGCTLKYTTHNVLVANIVDASVIPTLFLEPGGIGKVTLRIVDPIPTDEIVLNPVDPTTPVRPTIESTAINTQDLGDPTPEAPDATPPAVTATTLLIVSQPVSADVLESLGTISVRMMRTSDTGTNPVQGATVVAGIVTNPSGGQLGGQIAVLTSMDGYATFPNLTIDRAGLGYRLSFTASDAGALPVVSTPFNVALEEADPGQNAFLVTTTADSGPGSLRQAITNANNTLNGVGGPDIIAFAIRALVPQKIQLSSPLPDIGEPVFIDGTTQAGYNFTAGRPFVEVSGSALAASSIGFNFVGPGGSTIRGLSITGFGTPATPDTTAAIRIASPGVTVHANWIGISPIADAPATETVVGNQTGIWVTGGTAAIGGTGGGATRNVIGGGRAGILVSGGASHQIRGNYVGLGSDGSSAAPHTVNGISMFGPVTNAVIGGPVPLSGYFGTNSPANVISNSNIGISLQDSAGTGPSNTQILGNVLGLTVDGTGVGNTNSGISMRSAPGTRVGQPGAGNVVGGNNQAAGAGISVSATTPLAPGSQPIIQSNLIGLDPTGIDRRPYLQGIILFAAATIGGNSILGEGNIISGNGNVTATPVPSGFGITVNSAAVGSVIRGNTIGLNVAGAAQPNATAGINLVSAQQVMIGGTTAGQGNVISGNAFRGIHMVGASQVSILGNSIGTGVGNGGAGIAVLGGTAVTIGGNDPGTENIITGNGANPLPNPGGVVVSSPGTQAAILRNSIFNNSGPGIDIDPQGVVAPNDPGDGDTGANGGQNYPVVTGTGTGTTGELEIFLSTAPGVYTVRVYTNTACDPSGYGEGQNFLLETSLNTNAEGLANVLVPTPLTPGQILTATATDGSGNTSEFSACTTVTSNIVVVGPVGGSGGSPFGISCPANYVAVGFEGRAGDDVDSVQLLCAPRANLDGPRVLGGAAGGGGGSSYGATLTCDPGFFMTGVHGLAGNTGAGNVIDTLGVFCAHPLGGVTSNGPVALPHAGTASFSLSCPADRKIVGLQGRSGLVLDQISLMCQ